MKYQYQERESLEVGTQAPAGEYRCVCCGYVLRHTSSGRLPTCPADDGLHALKAWFPGDSRADASPRAAHVPKKPR